MSAATGNFGAAFFLRRTDLQGDRHPVEAGQRVEGSVAAGHLWLQNGVGAALVCANPTTGRVQGEVSATQSLGPRFNGLSNVVAAGGFVFVGTGGGLLRIEPGLCRSSSATPTQGASPAPTTSELTVSLPEPVAQTFAAGSDWVIDDDGLVRLDRSGKVIARVPGLRGDIAGDDAGVWVIAQDGTLSRFDPATNQVAAISVPVKDASYIAIGAGGVWIAGGPNLQFPGGPGGRQLVEVDPSTDKVALHTTVLCPSSAPCTLTSLAADATAVWVGINPFDSDSDVVAKIDPASGNVTATTSSGGRLGVALATGEGALWAAGEGLDRIDPQTGKVTSHIECCLFPPDQGTVAVGAGYVWVVDFGGLVTQVDPTTNRVVNTFIPFPNLYGIGSPAPTQDGVWIIGPGEVVLVRP